MPLFLRLFFLGTGLMLTVLMTVAFIAVFNTWRLYAFPLAPAIGLEVLIAAIFSVAVWVLSVAVRYRDPRKPKKTKPQKWPYSSFSGSLNNRQAFSDRDGQTRPY